jgi:BirA family transcriptional regulator, biotin operon repressor / biotin---[acetyl-CoA-carboxylase] ligase
VIRASHSSVGYFFESLRVSMHRIHFDATDSTNNEARRLAAVHPGEVLLVTAATQSAGRGRQGRVWESPRGGAWFSLVWQTRQPPATYANVSLLAAIAVRRAIAEVVDAERLLIKWPNDVLVDDKKVSGILCEQWPGESGSLGVLVIGIGVNIDFDLALLPTDLRHPATTLSTAVGHAIPVDAVIDAVAEQLTALLAEFESSGLNTELIAELRGHLAYVGEERVWQSPQGEVVGKVLGIDDTGRLLLEVDGQVRVYDVGEFAPIRA